MRVWVIYIERERNGECVRAKDREELLKIECLLWDRERYRQRVSESVSVCVCV